MRIRLILASIALLTTVLLPKSTISEEKPEENPFGSSWQEEENDPKRTYPREGKRTGSRNPLECEYPVNTTIKTLRPDTDENIYTQKSHPNFLFYIQGQPQSSQQAKPIKIRYSIVDLKAAKTVIYSNFEIEQTNTLIALSLPEEISGLEAGKEYRFTIGLICQEDRPNRDRIDIFFVEKLEKPTHKIWFDDLYQAFNQEDQASFKELLEEENLSFDSKFLSAQEVAIAPDDKQKELDP